MRTQQFKRVILMTLILLIMFTSIPIKAYAHNAYYLEVLIDTTTYTYVGSVLEDNAGFLKSEDKHIGGQLYGSFNDDAQLYTFPSHEIDGSWIYASAANDADQYDFERAALIKDTLIPALNAGVRMLNNNEDITSAGELKALTTSLLGSPKAYATSEDKSKNPYITRYVIVDGVKLPFEMAKGYAGPDTSLVKPFLSEGYDADVSSRLSMQDLVAQADFAFGEDLTAFNSGGFSEPGSVEKVFSGILTATSRGIQSLLGLYSIEELVYNQGIRGTSLYPYGTMNQEWYRNSLTFHLIFQALAWSVMTLAILKMLFQRNVATVNLRYKINLIEGIKDIMMTAVLLATGYLLITSLLFINTKLVEVFQTTVQGSMKFGAPTVGQGTLASGLIEIFYLFIAIYLNAVYIVRGLTLAVLIGSAPFFIMTIAFDSKSKGLFTGWLKELMSNIFVQSFHAFVLSIFLASQLATTRGIETAIMLLALIPVTNMFRMLITGHAGGAMGIVGEGSTKRAAAAAGVIGAGALAFVGSKRNDAMSRQGGGGNSETPGTGEFPQRKEHSAQTPNKKTTGETMDSRPQSTNGDGTFRTPEDFSEKSASRFNPERASQGDANKSIGKGMAKTAAGGLGMAAGLGAAVITGNSNSGRNLMEKGAQGVKGGAKETFTGARQLGGMGLGEIQQRFGDGDGAIIGAETLSNGDTVVHKDLDVMKDHGMVNVTNSKDGPATITYDTSNFTPEQKTSMNNIKEEWDKGNYDYLESKGISGYGTNAKGETMVSYNNYGKEQLGFKDAYTNGNKWVETKRADQPMKTNTIYDPRKVEARPEKFDGGNSSNKNVKPTNMDNKM